MNEFEIKILLSLFSLGLFGGFSHCGFMCGPFVLMQVNNNLKNIKIENLTYLKKLKGLALLPYHCGRITTYGFLGLISAILGSNIRNNSDLHLASAIMLFLAALSIFFLILKNFKIEFYSYLFHKRLKVSYNFIPITKIRNILSYFFQNPRGFKGYFLGIILGFIPCGLLYSALLIAANFDNYFIAAFAMIIFGIATIPALFLSAIGGYLFFSKMKFGFKIFAQFILLINMITLFIMAFFQIRLI